MELSAALYLVLLAAVSCGRFAELWLSRRNRRGLSGLGARQVRDPIYPLMVLLHVGMLGGSALEVVLLRRPLIPWLAAGAGVTFVLSNLLRLWVIRTLGGQWTVQVMAGLAVITSGPFRSVRHPNYAGVFLEMISLPLIHTAWLTATVGTLCHIPILWRRIQVEEAVLMQNPEYTAAFAGKPRFVPSLRRLREPGT